MSRNKAILTTCLIFITYFFLMLNNKIDGVAGEVDDKSYQLEESQASIEDVRSELESTKARIDEVEDKLNL